MDGDVIGCEDQTLGEVIGVVGTPFTLHYSSAPVPGRGTILISLSGAEIPPEVDRYRITVRVAGREFEETVDCCGALSPR